MLFQFEAKCLCGWAVASVQFSVDREKHKFVDTKPKSNSFVAFPSWAPHEVRTVLCPTKKIMDWRFSINAWVYRVLAGVLHEVAAGRQVRNEMDGHFSLVNMRLQLGWITKFVHIECKHWQDIYIHLISLCICRLARMLVEAPGPSWAAKPGIWIRRDNDFSTRRANACRRCE